MASFREGRVVEMVEVTDDLVRARVDADGERLDAVGYPFMLGPCERGDRVVVNTTGIDLGLGTGGVAFMLWNLDGDAPKSGPGHIVKMRYTPWQTEVDAAEAPESPHHDALAETTSIGGMPVVAASLHSQVPAVAAGVKAAAPGAGIGYLMTGGGALPLAFSDLVRAMRGADLVDVTCTCGHAFGGDLEAVNIFSGLTSLRVAGGADVAIVAMGPGVVGTATALGFSGIEQGQTLDAATALGGRSIAALRISFADERARHRGVSHHSLTALSIAARERTTVVVPELGDDQTVFVNEQLAEAGITTRHEIVTEDGEPGLDLLRARSVIPASMGRSMDKHPELFLAAAAAGRHAACHL